MNNNIPNEAREAFGLNNNPASAKYEYKDFGSRRVYPTPSTMGGKDGVTWIGNSYSIHDAWGDAGKETEKGSNIFKLPDGRYYYGNSRFASASYDTEENLKNHLANKAKSDRKSIGVLSGEDRAKMEELAQAMRDAGMDANVKDMMFDAGQNWEYTGIVRDGYQALNPRDWEEYMNGDITAEELVYLMNKGK